jgi:hypothetical protein
MISLNAIAIEEHNANNCEFYVDGFAETYSSYNNMGVWSKAIRTELKVPASQTIKRVIQVGQWVKWNDGSDQIVNDNDFRGLLLYKREYSASDKKWIIEVPFAGVEMNSPSSRNRYDRKIVETAYFIDIERFNQQVVRLWLSNQGKNFRPEEILSENTHNIFRGPSSYKWADQKAQIFDQKYLCK